VQVGDGDAVADGDADFVGVALVVELDVVAGEVVSGAVEMLPEALAVAESLGEALAEAEEDFLLLAEGEAERSESGSAEVPVAPGEGLRLVAAPIALSGASCESAVPVTKVTMGSSATLTPMASTRPAPTAVPSSSRDLPRPRARRVPLLPRCSLRRRAARPAPSTTTGTAAPLSAPLSLDEGASEAAPAPSSLAGVPHPGQDRAPLM
jgi:predicted RNase H-like HicB family nuclease